MKEVDDFNITFLDGKEVLDSTPLPRSPRVQSGTFYEEILKLQQLRLIMQKEEDEEYDTMEEHFDLMDDEDDESDIPLTEYEKSALELEKNMLFVDNPASENPPPSPPSNGDGGDNPPAPQGGGVSKGEG